YPIKACSGTTTRGADISSPLAFAEGLLYLKEGFLI
ncbi:unnamed protein product, partial [marine sediment metagenome]